MVQIHSGAPYFTESIMKLFVWEYVLGGGLSDGMVVVYAEDKEHALRVLKEKDSSAYNDVVGSEPEIVASAKAFVVYGFG